MKLEHLRYLCQITPGLSLNTLSKNMHISQQGLSAAIKSLEQEMGCALIERTGKGVYFTEAGEELVHYTSTYLENVRRIKLSQSPLSGDMFLPVTPCVIPFYMGELISRYMKENPGVHLSFAYSSATEKCLAYLLNGEAEIAFGFNSRVRKQPVTNILQLIEDSGCRFVVCKTMISCIECHKDFLAQDRQYRLSELSDERCIIYMYNNDSIGDVSAMLRACGCQSPVDNEYNRDLYFEHLLNKRGYGLSIYNNSKFNHYRANELTQHLLKDDATVEYGYIIKKDTELSPPVQRFVELMQAVMI